MSTPQFDWGTLVEGVLSALGNIFKAVVDGIASNASTIGSIFASVLVGAVALGMVARVPVLGDLLGALRGWIRI